MTKRSHHEAASRWLFRYALFVAACALLVLVSGAYITSSEEQAVSTDQSVLAGSGQVPALQAILTARNHTALAIAAGIFACGLVAWLMVGKDGWLRLSGGAGLALFALDGWLGGHGHPPLSPAIGVCHAVLAHLFFSTIVAIAVLTSPGWTRGPEPVEDRGHTSLRALAVAAPFVVLMQITLGALYRHNVTGVLWHMGGALVATIVILVVCLIVTQFFADNRSLHSAAIALISILLTQLSLGIATFTMKLLNFEDTVVFLFSSVFHVMVGSLTLAATVVMAMQVRRNLLPSK